MEEQLIKFIKTKDYKQIKEIGQGGTGKTVLLKDETIDELFVCKKYATYYPAHQELYYQNFVAEIKLLHKLYHKNVVRVFNYYLYPKHSTGYILMEYIDGLTIDRYIQNFPELINDVFEQTISGFCHLEQANILHRDIRPSNILISTDGTVKIIDFGFSKVIEHTTDDINSVSLAWYFTVPGDFVQRTYNHRTEIYFVGKLFEQLIIDNKIQHFSYTSLLDTMTKYDSQERVPSFFDIERRIIEDGAEVFEFNHIEKLTYQQFANELQQVVATTAENTEYYKDIDQIIVKLEELYRNSMLEVKVQRPELVARCFLKGTFHFSKKASVDTENLLCFIKILKRSTFDKQRIIINNLWQRLDSIPRYTPTPIDDLPF